MPKTPEGRQKRFQFSIERIEKLPVPKDNPDIYYDRDVRQLGIRVQPSGRRTFFVLKRARGKTYRRTLGQHPDLRIERARKYARDVLNEVADWTASGYEGLCPLAKSTDGELTFASAFEMYVRSPRPRAKDHKKAEERSRELYDKYLTRLVNRNVDEITMTEAANLHDKITEDHGPVVANRALEIVRATFNFLIKKELCAANPCRGVTMHRVNKRTRFLQPDELVRFTAAIAVEQNKDLCDFVTLLLATGVRKSNLYGAKWNDISFERETWTIDAAEAKAGKTLTISLTPRARDVLKARFGKRQKDCPWVFPSSTSESGHVEDFKRQWHRLRKAAGLTDVVMHSLRHTFGSYQAIAGSSLKQIGTSLGHSSPASTDIYSHLLDSAVRQSQLAGEETQRRLMAEAEKNQKLLAAR